MAEKNVTEIIIKADLQCDCCYKKLCKLLSGYPEIRDWIFNEDSNTVTITVTGSDPEKLLYKLCRNSRGVIKGIEIKQPGETAPAVEPPKPKEVTPPTKPEPAVKAPEPVQPQPEPSSKAVEQNQVGHQCFGPGPMPVVCRHCYGSGVVAPRNNGYRGPPLFFEGYIYGRIGYGPAPNHCNHPSNPPEGWR